MWKLVFICAALVVSASPVDAREVTKGRELARELERLSREVYRDEGSASAPARSSLAAGRAEKKR